MSAPLHGSAEHPPSPKQQQHSATPQEETQQQQIEAPKPHTTPKHTGNLLLLLLSARGS
jgi:hypothetical protein